MPIPAPSGLLARIFQLDYWIGVVADVLTGLILPPGSPSDLGILCLQALIGPDMTPDRLIDRWITLMNEAWSFAPSKS